jgi:protein ImuB
MRLAAVDSSALALGLAPGLSLADARAREPDVAVVDHDPPADLRWLERIADGCARYTPMVEIDPPDGLLLDISGCAHLFGGEGGLARDIEARLVRLGMTTRLACASNPRAAHALARHGFTGGDETAAIARLPVSALRIDGERETALRRAGLKTIADLADRPTAPLAARFGDETVTALARLLGRADIRLTPRRPLPALVVEQRFAEPLAHTDHALAVLDELMVDAARQLGERHQGGRRFEAYFFRTDGLVQRIAIETGLPTRDQAVTLRLFRERVETLADPLDPGFGFDLIRLTVPVLDPLAPVQLRIDGRERPEAEIAALIDRLGTRLGHDRLRRFVPRDTHIPERAATTHPAIETRAAGGWPAQEPGEPPLRPLHLFDPPQSIEVVAEAPDGPPHRFKWRSVLHDVIRAEGPERIASEWWRHDKALPTRDYFRVEDAHGHRFWIFRHGLFERETMSPGWYLHGLFA